MKVTKEKINFLLVFLIFFLSTRASGLSMSNIVLLGTLVLNIAVAFSRRIKIDRPFIAFFIFLLLIIFQNFIQLEEHFDLWRYVKLLALVMTAYLTIKTVRFSFFTHFNKIVLYAILISLPFYVWQLLSIESLHNTGKVLNGLFSGIMDVSAVVENQSLNMLVHTIEFVENFRNSGVMWEPGGFATIIVLALFFELLQNGFSFSKRCCMYVLGVFITFSTTGYITALVVMFFYLSRKARLSRSRQYKPMYYFMIPVFAMVTAIVFFCTPIFYKKIVTEISVQGEMIQNISNYGDTFKSLGRFGSLQVDVKSIQDNFLFGRGYTDGSFRLKYEHLNFTNGLSTFVGRMGLIGLSWLVLSLFKSGKLIVNGLSGAGSGSFIYFILIILISFSNPVLFTPLFMVLQLFFLPFKLTPDERY